VRITEIISCIQINGALSNTRLRIVNALSLVMAYKQSLEQTNIIGIIMKPLGNLYLIVALISAIAFSNSAFARGGKYYTGQTIDAEYVIGLSVAEAEDLVYMREEEKLAHDVYITFYKQWGLQIFTNIADSETIHTETVKSLLDNYGLTDLALDQVGAFTNTNLQALYDQLVDRGMASAMEALHVGAFIEEVDMADLQHAIDRATHDDIIAVYENLLKGSRNHLRAYVDVIESYGVVYEAQYLEQDEVDAIVDSPKERGTVSL